jgi:hypothetical protein
MKKKSVIMLLASLLILFWFIDVANQSPSPVPLESLQQYSKGEAKSLQILPPARSVINTLKLPLPIKPNLLAKKPSNDCMSRSEYYAKPEVATLEHWLLEHIGIGQIGNENYLNEAELTEQAHAGNAYAMLLLV